MKTLKLIFATIICVAMTLPLIGCKEEKEFSIFEDLTNDEMVKVEGGTFTMGATSEQADKYGSYSYYECPKHEVTLSDYYIGKYEVTQGLWEYVMSYAGVCADGSTISAYPNAVWLSGKPTSAHGKGSDFPAYNVKFSDIVNKFIPRLNQITGKTFRLPTEAEWEYAARGGKMSKGYRFSGGNNLDDVAWHWGNSRYNKYDVRPHQVGTKLPNELGIYDMSGNMWEWCADWYGQYKSEPQTDPTGPTKGSQRVIRGGDCGNDEYRCRVAYRDGMSPVYPYSSVGFRLVCIPEK